MNGQLGLKVVNAAKHLWSELMKSVSTTSTTILSATKHLDQGRPTHCPGAFFCPWGLFKMPLKLFLKFVYKISSIRKINFSSKKKFCHQFLDVTIKILFKILLLSTAGQNKRYHNLWIWAFGEKMPSEVLFTLILPSHQKSSPPLTETDVALLMETRNT